MKKRIDFRNDERNILMNYLIAKANKAKAEKDEKAAKAAAKEVLEQLGKSFKQTDKSSYVYGTVQVQGEAKAIVYRETIAKGQIDWQAYAMALGGTAEGAEEYRKADTLRTALDWATDTQQREIDSESNEDNQ